MKYTLNAGYTFKQFNQRGNTIQQ